MAVWDFSVAGKNFWGGQFLSNLEEKSRKSNRIKIFFAVLRRYGINCHIKMQ